MTDGSFWVNVLKQSDKGDETGGEEEKTQSSIVATSNYPKRQHETRATNWLDRFQKHGTFSIAQNVADT